MRPLLLLLLIAGCAAGDTRNRDREDFDRELAGRVAGPPQDCIPIQTGTGFRIVDGQTLAYGSGRTIWANRLRSECPGLRPLDTLIVDVQGSRYCRGDHVRSVAPGSSIPGPVCVLGDFTPYRLPH